MCNAFKLVKQKIKNFQLEEYGPKLWSWKKLVKQEVIGMSSR